MLDEVLQLDQISVEAISNDDDEEIKNDDGVVNSSFIGNHHVKKNEKDDELVEMKERRTSISYEVVFWIVFIISIILCVLDRFLGTGDITLRRSSKLIAAPCLLQ